MTTSQGRDSRGGGRPGTRRFSGRRRRQCVCKEVGAVDYKDVSVLRRFINDRGRIESGRKSGNCAKCQRELSTAISRARHLALLPFAPSHLRVTGSISQAAAPSESDGEESGSDESTEAAASVESSDESEQSEETTDTTEATETEASAESEDSADAEDDSEAADEPEASSEAEEASEDEDSDESDESSDAEAEADSEPEEEEK